MVGASLNDQSEYGESPLHLAVYHGNWEVTQLLLQKSEFSLKFEFMNGAYKYRRVI